MKIKRIGINSMGLSLIFFGLIMIISQFSQLGAFDLLIKLWPLILIFIGLEVIYINYRYGNSEDYSIKLDFWSVLIIMFILFTNIFLYGLMEIGLIDIIKKEIDHRNRSYDIGLNMEKTKYINWELIDS